MLIYFLYFVVIPIICVLVFRETIEKRSRGALIPMEKKKNVKIFSKKPIRVIALANRAAIKRGLHGTIIAPKKKPKKNARSKGFFTLGAFKRGRYEPTSTLKIRRRLINKSKINAIGEITLIILVRDT